MRKGDNEGWSASPETSPEAAIESAETTVLTLP
jgi:hypothetical protein